jgi:hypothetical protein
MARREARYVAGRITLEITVVSVAPRVFAAAMRSAGIRIMLCKRIKKDIGIKMHVITSAAAVVVNRRGGGNRNGRYGKVALSAYRSPIQE